MVLGVALVVALGTAGAAVAASGGGVKANVAASDAQVFVAMSPVRVLDTRAGFGGPIGVPAAGQLGPGATLNLRLSGSGKPLPAEAVAGVINVTIDQDATQKSL
jgi:hypothetical protein